MQFIACACRRHFRKLPVTSGWFVSRTTSEVPLEEANVKPSLHNVVSIHDIKTKWSLYVYSRRAWVWRQMRVVEYMLMDMILYQWNIQSICCRTWYPCYMYISYTSKVNALLYISYEITLQQCISQFITLCSSVHCVEFHVVYMCVMTCSIILRYILYSCTIDLHCRL